MYCVVGVPLHAWLAAASTCTAFCCCVLTAAAAACCLQNIKKKFPLVLGRINQLIGRLEALGPTASIDVSGQATSSRAAGGCSRVFFWGGAAWGVMRAGAGGWAAGMGPQACIDVSGIGGEWVQQWGCSGRSAAACSNRRTAVWLQQYRCRSL
jgi:hypothetical protein